MNKHQLASTIWESANQMRSKIEANEYKDFILGFIFYKYLSERELDLFQKEKLSEDEIKKVDEKDVKYAKHVRETLGYFIAYDNLFSTWLAKGNDFDVKDVRDALSDFDQNIDEVYKKVFEKIFNTLQTGLSKLGETSGSQTKAVKKLLKLIKKIPMDGKQDYDVLGFIYEYLISNFAATEFFIVVEHQNFRQSRLAMLVDAYLRYFLLSGGQDPYPENEFDRKHKTKVETVSMDTDSNSKPVGVVLTDEVMEGKTITTSVKKAKLKEWYSESKALACMVDTDCFAYVDNKLCVYDKKYLERDDKGKLFFTEYAKAHEEECFLQFVMDKETGELHYITLPSSMASKTFNYYDELSALSDDEKLSLGLVNEIAREMLAAINGMEFGEALATLMDKKICNVSFRTLKSVTGLDNTTVSNMKKGKNLTKENVVSCCLGIHIPFRLSNRLLQLAERPLDLTLPGAKGEENTIYDQILHLYWAEDYSDTYAELVAIHYEHLIHQPPIK